MISKNLDLIKNKQTLATHFYYTKQQPVSAITALNDSRQDINFRVQTFSKPVCLSKCSLNFRIQTQNITNADSVFILSNLKGFIDGLTLYTGSGQKLFSVDRHLWAYAQIRAMHQSESHVDRDGEFYEGRYYKGTVVSSATANANNGPTVDEKRILDEGLFCQIPSAGNQPIILDIVIPLSKFGGIFDEKQGVIPFVDDLLEFTFNTMKTTDYCNIVKNTGVSEDGGNVFTGNLAVSQMYLNIARSRDEQINTGLIQQVQSGVVLPYHYVTAKYETATGTTSQVNHSLTQNEGMKIFQIDTAFLSQNQTLGAFAANVGNLSGFIPVSNSVNALQKEITFNNELISSEYAYMQSNDLKLNKFQLKARYHVHLSLTDDPEQIDSGFDLSNLPSTNYMLTTSYSGGGLSANTQVATFFTGVQYLRMNANNIKTQGQ